MEFIFEHFLGTIVNFIGVIIAGVCGALLKRGVPKRFSDIIMSAMALCVIYIGIDGALAEAPAVNEESFLSAGLMKILVMIVSMAVGTVIGELIDIDGTNFKIKYISNHFSHLSFDFISYNCNANLFAY